MHKKTLQNTRSFAVKSLLFFSIAYSAVGHAETRCEKSFEHQSPAQTINVCREEIQGPISDPMREKILEILGRAYQAQGENDIAIASWNEASQYVLPSANNPKATETWAQLQTLIGQTYSLMNKPDLALAQYQKSITRARNVAGYFSVPVAILSDSMGTYYAQQKELKKADRAFLHARIVYEIRLGKTDPKAIDTRLNHAVGLMDMGKMDEAYASFKRLADLVDNLPQYQNAPVRAEILTFLGTMEMQHQDLLSAAKHYETAYTVRAAAFGPNDLRTSQSLNNLGVVLFRAGYLKRAEQALSKAYIIRKDLLGDNDTLTVSTRKNLQAVIAAEDSGQQPRTH